MISSATDVVSSFGSLIVLVAGLSFGVFGVKFLIGTIKKARG